MKMTSFDPTYQKYPSRRYPLFAKNGMVNCSTPQAAAAGLEILKPGFPEHITMGSVTFRPLVSPAKV